MLSLFFEIVRPLDYFLFSQQRPGQVSIQYSYSSCKSYRKLGLLLYFRLETIADLVCFAFVWSTNGIACLALSSLSSMELLSLGMVYIHFNGFFFIIFFLCVSYFLFCFSLFLSFSFHFYFGISRFLVVTGIKPRILAGQLFTFIISFEICFGLT